MASSSDSVLGTQVKPDEAISSTHPPQSYTYYHAGPLFSIGDLQTNVRLSRRIRELSGGKYQPVLPQDLEQRDTTPHSIRDQDIKALLKCDLALFTYDGAELDSGTVVEYMMAKFADMPAVILRSDFRGAGDQAEYKGDPWNLMSSFWPRTVGVVVNGMVEYKTGLSQASSTGGPGESQDISNVSLQAGERLVDVTAQRVIDAFGQALSKPAKLPKELRESVYKWLALMPGFKFGDDQTNTEELLQLLQGKKSRGLI